ncbi:hypothetical protein F5Y12DRAFT_482167 [Xylaria sp. FL1777]|nr:hypothetical protein F5Y12DRAFT_482167 [Xylaria sp. FL1777]
MMHLTLPNEPQTSQVIHEANTASHYIRNQTTQRLKQSWDKHRPYSLNSPRFPHKSFIYDIRHNQHSIKQDYPYAIMCSTIIFQYRCGCAERVVFECPFSLTAISSPGSSKSLRAHVHKNCSRRYRLHQQKLFSLKRTTEKSSTPSLHQAPSSPLQMEIPILPPPQPPCRQIGKAEEQNASETAVTEIDEICHDCWQHELRLAKKTEDDGASSTTMRDGEEQGENIANTHVLKERPVNELILPPPNMSLEAVSSTESFPEN